MLALRAELRRDVVFVEPCPSRRRTFASELVPLRAAARAAGALCVGIVRDILVGSRANQPKFHERASTTANAPFLAGDE